MDEPRLPADWIVEGYDVHVVFSSSQEAEAVALFTAFSEYVAAEQIPHQRALIFKAPVGPWPTPMWQILLRRLGSRDDLERDLGKCIAWMMLNRGELSAMFHPNTRTAEDFGGGLRDHRDYSLWLGPAQQLRLGIFGG